MSLSINPSMIARLISKDWQLFKWFALIYIALGIGSVLIMTISAISAFHTGVVMLITVLIGASAHVVFMLVVLEKKENQMSFVIGLPINPTDYAVSKIVGGFCVYLVCWLPILGALLLVLGLTDLPNGLMPMAIILSLEILLATSLLLCVAVVSGHEGVTIVVMVFFNLMFNLFLFSVVRIPDIYLHMESPEAVFNTTVMQFIAAEIGLIALVVIGTSYYKSRKACFL